MCEGACGRKEENYCVRGSVRGRRRKLMCAEEREGGKKKNYCVRGSVREERRELLCAGEREDGKK